MGVGESQKNATSWLYFCQPPLALYSFEASCGSGRIGVWESGYIRLELSTLLFTIAGSSIVIVGILLMQGVGAEIVGGIVGGLVVAIFIGLSGWWYPRLKQWLKNRAYAI